jgi:hypothetical protein
MGRFIISVLLAAMVIAVAAGGWMVLTGGGSPELTEAHPQSAIGPGGSDMSEPRVLGMPGIPGRLADEKSSPATTAIDSGSDGPDWGWTISLAIAVSLAAVPIVGIYELRGLRLRGK